MDPNTLFLDPRRPFSDPKSGVLYDPSWKFLQDLKTGLTTVDLTDQVTGVLPSANGGTGINNHGRTLTIAGASLTLTQTGATSLATPTAGTLISTTGLQLQSATTGSVAGGGTALVTLTWPLGFADTNYVAVASVLDTTAAVASLSVVHIESQLAASIQVRVTNAAVGAITGIVWAIALHA